MKDLLKKIKTLSMVVGFLILPVQAEVIDEIEKSFNVTDTSSFSLENINGNVAIESWQKPSIKVVAEIRAKDQASRNRITIKMHQNEQQVQVATHYQESSSWGNNQGGIVNYKIWLPEGTDLDKVNLVNGSLNIVNVSGEVNAQLVNGSVVATGLSKNSDISSVNGSVKVYYHSISDELDDIDIETVNGSIKLFLPKDISAKLALETMHGSIKTEFGLASEKNIFTGHSLSGSIGSGSVDVTMESVNGSINVLKK